MIEPPRGGLSLRARLLLIPSAIVIVVIVAALVLLAAQSRQRVAAEQASSVELARHLAGAAIKSLDPATFDPDTALLTILHDMPPLRHVRLFVLPAEAAALDTFRTQSAQSQSRPIRRLLHPEPWEATLPIMVNGTGLGSIAIVSDPGDELDEISSEFTFVAVLLLGLTALFVVLAWWIVAQALRPLHLLNMGLGKLEHGDFSATLPPFTLPELTAIGETFNHLSQALGHAQTENQLLIGRMISLQETERGELAGELHDELGPCLFGIKSEAACINRAAPTLDAAEASARAGTITRLVDDIQRMNRRILARLKPIALEDLGLKAALEALVQDWRERVPDTDWIFTCQAYDRAPKGEQALTLYRVAQECLTNAARHSEAATVGIILSCTDEARLVITDDGKGIDPARPLTGFGLLGIRERVRAAGGSVIRVSDPGNGTRIDVCVPLTTVTEE